MDLAGVPGSTDRINIYDSDSDSTDNDVCVRRFVKFARQKSFSG